MCGLAGVIFGRKRQRAEERDHLAWLFTRLLVLSESRGPHATGVVWRNRGDERMNRNNHPIRAKDVIGTHNGTIYTADRLFRRLRLRRFAEVDSELLFRLADRAFRDETRDLERFKHDLALCRGQITAVLASRRQPGTVLVLKGNKPLKRRIHRRPWALLYASDPAVLDALLADERGWRPLPLEPRDASSCSGTTVSWSSPGSRSPSSPRENGGRRRDREPHEPKRITHESQ